MRLTVVNVSYPFAPVSADPVGGAEQVLMHLDRALVEAGHRSIVIAPERSSARGELLAIPAVDGPITGTERARIHAAVRRAVGSALARERVNVVHLHGIDFDAYLPPPGPPVLVTLHLPLQWYGRSALAPSRPRVWLHPVSHSQAATAPAGAMLAPPIDNGVEIAPAPARKRGFALALGRICPEKGFEDAIEACERAATPLLIAGAAYPYPEHEHYLRTRILPRLDRKRRWIGPIEGRRKRRLLAQARCLLVPSKAPETSSLAAMEALAAGTPVIAYRAGALPDIVEHGETGFLVDDAAAMAEAIGAAHGIDPERCRRRARERFPVDRMTRSYLRRYAELAAA